MTSLVAKYISKRILGESLQNKFGTEDAYFEQVPATRLNGRPSSKTKKRRKALPAGISKHDGKILTKVKRRAYRLDMSLFNCCGIRFGWGSVIGIIPGIGDVIDAFMAIMVLRTCEQVEGGLPVDVKSKMIFNIIVDFGIGLIPLVGDFADAIFRANTKNAVILETFLRKKGAANLKAQGQLLPVVDPSDPDEYDRHLRDERGPPPGYTSVTPSNQNNEQQGSHNPASSAHINHPQQSQNSGGWFRSLFGRQKKDDLEVGASSVRRQDEVLPPPLPPNPTRNKPVLTKSRLAN